MQSFEKAFENVERPFAWVDMNALDANIRFINHHVKEKNVRIATKSIRSIPLLRYLNEKLSNVSGLMTFTASETCYLLENGFDHLLLGYPVLEEKSVLELYKYIKKGYDVCFMVDDIRQAKWLNELAKRSNVNVGICIDINLSIELPFIFFGTRRSAITNLKDLENLLELLKKQTHLHIEGVMGYEAQLAGVGDLPIQKWKRPVIQQLQKVSKNRVAKLRKEAVDFILAEIGEVEFVNGGGSGSIDFTAQSSEVTEITIGSAFFNPALFDQYSQLDLQPAAGFALRVTRNPARDVVVCHGGGYIASGAIGKDKQPVPYEAQHFAFLPLEGAGEVQTPLRRKDHQNPKIGDTIYFRHAKAGELCERFTQLEAVRSGQHVNCFKTYRGEGKCFL
ncbi:alanine racemase [Rummeliibacillus sp. NPDC094406]|uniref:alanine racemase n=1 Tax=Rummeliibacillus sp. NPDC094406 TaxID=3364511 RepID=UPI0037F2DA30